MKTIEIPDSEMPVGTMSMRRAFDAAWEAVLRTESLKAARIKLSVHELRGILGVAVPAAVYSSSRQQDSDEKPIHRGQRCAAQETPRFPGACQHGRRFVKAADLKEQTTYVGKSGKRRFVRSIDRYTVTYDVPEGGLFSCLKSTFAQWAVREAIPEERAP